LLLYYVTDRTQFPGDETARRRRLLEKIAEASRAGLDYIQLRERDLSAQDLETLAHAALHTIRENQGKHCTRFLINSRTDIAIACHADGVHLRSNDVTASDVRSVWRHAMKGPAIISISCHTAGEVAQTKAAGADLALFAAVFEKKDDPKISGAGLSNLGEACQRGIPVLALGGITLRNARSCCDAGATGVAAIRLFQKNDIARVVRELRG